MTNYSCTKDNVEKDSTNTELSTNISDVNSTPDVVTASITPPPLLDCFDPVSNGCMFVEHKSETISVPGYCDIAVEYDVWDCGNGGSIAAFVFENLVWNLTHPSCDALLAHWIALFDTDPDQLADELDLFEFTFRRLISDSYVGNHVLLNLPHTNFGGDYSASGKFYLSSCTQWCYFDNGPTLPPFLYKFDCGYGCCLELTDYCYNPVTMEIEQTLTRQTTTLCEVAPIPLCNGELLGTCENLCDKEFGHPQ